MLPAFIIVFAIASGAWLTFVCRKDLRLAWQSRRWPKVTGQICGSVVVEGIGVGMTADGTFAPTTGPFKEIDRVFTYCVSGRYYRSSRFGFGGVGWQENDRYYEDGDQVDVYYCPSDPATGVLKPGLAPGLMTGPILIAIGVCWFVWIVTRAPSTDF